MVTGGMATLVGGTCYCHSGKWNRYTGWNDLIMAGVIAFVADGMTTGSIVCLILFYFKF